jgi:hypothetical protein
MNWLGRRDSNYERPRLKLKKYLAKSFLGDIRAKTAGADLKILAKGALEHTSGKEDRTRPILPGYTWFFPEVRGSSRCPYLVGLAAKTRFAMKPVSTAVPGTNITFFQIKTHMFIFPQFLKT